MGPSFRPPLDPLSGPRGRMDTEPPDRAPKMSNYLASGVRGGVCLGTLPPAPPGAFTQLERWKHAWTGLLREEMSELEQVRGALAVRD